MTKLYELLGQRPCKGDVGIEIECEGEGLQVVDGVFWRTENDGSLRGNYPDEACEWVLKRPIAIGKVDAAITELIEAQSGRDTKINFSFRTSTHVHINVQQLEFNEVVNMVYAYLLCETVLMNYCGKSRIGNRFCLRLEDAEGLLEYVSKIVQGGEKKFLRNNPENQIRYASINMEALWKYGSLEFRGLEGTLDSERIETWVGAMASLREFAKKHKDIRSVHDFFVMTSPEQFFDEVIGEFSDAFKYEGFKDDLRRSFSLTIDLPYSYKEYVPEVKVDGLAEFAKLMRENQPVNPMDVWPAAEDALRAPRRNRVVFNLPPPAVEVQARMPVNQLIAEDLQ